QALTAQGHPVSDDTVGRLLREQGYRLQRTLKTLEGAQHAARAPQFRSLNEQAKVHLADGQPVVSVDTKKKELVGNFADGGQEWQPSGEPERVNVHDFPDPKLGKAIPYGVYDLGRNAGWVGVGVDHDTAAFAVQTLRRWGEQRGGAAGRRHRWGSGGWSRLMLVVPPASGSGRGSPSWPGLRPRRGWRSLSA